MKKIITTSLWLTVMIVAGCAHPNYRVSAYNDTMSKITEVNVTLSNGEVLGFGTLYPAIDKSIWPVRGPIHKESLVKWKSAVAPKSAKATVSCGAGDDSVIFVIRSNDMVTVVTGKGLYEYRKER